MIAAEIGVRALVAPMRPPQKKPRSPNGRIAPYGARVLVFDTETTADFSQRLLFGFFMLVVDGKLELEGAIVPSWVSAKKRKIIEAELADSRRPILTLEWFIEDVFYPETWGLGALCVGFNLPFRPIASGDPRRLWARRVS
jgi:hypothetical protein